MAEFATIARPYANALFGLAQESNKLVPWLSELETLVQIVSQPKVQAYLDQPELSSEARTKEILALCNDFGGEAALQNFVTVVSENGRLVVLPEILAQYQDLMLQASGIQKAVVYSAYPVSDEQLAQIVSDLKQRFGTELQATVEIKPELIGGVKIEVGDQVLDMSVQGKLNALYSAIKS